MKQIYNEVENYANDKKKFLTLIVVVCIIIGLLLLSTNI